VACCFVQGLVLQRPIGHGTINVANLRLILPKFLGSYLVGNLRHVTDKTLWFAASLIVAFLIATVFFVKTQSKYLFLLGLWLGAMLLSAQRVDLSLIHPHFAGPRYFFFPFVLLSWFLISLLIECDCKWLRLAAGSLIFVSVLNALPVLSRSHADFKWGEHLVSCNHFDRYEIPFPYDGYRAWFLLLDHNQCESLQHWGLINLGGRMGTVKSYPYRIVSIDASTLQSKGLADAHVAGVSALIDDKWRGSDYERSEVLGLKVIGSVRRGDIDEGTLTVRLHRGERLLFRSGPVVSQQTVSIQDDGRFFEHAPAAPDWMILEFSNNELHDEFTALFSDKGSSFGEWSAVALRSETLK